MTTMPRCDPLLQLPTLNPSAMTREETLIATIATFLETTAAYLALPRDAGSRPSMRSIPVLDFIPPTMATYTPEAQ